ncbi:MAG: type II toxin-antitoxin system VapC family toxin [Azospirillaceae bacterium]|nr:type II toxin-antitoxin system VapC family toxin [Azospirillaceae bacterium]
MRVEQLAVRLVVDASVGLKWVVAENDSGKAIQLLRTGRQLVTSALFWAEAGNALAIKAKRGELESAAATDALQDLSGAPLITQPLDADAAVAALSLAKELSHPIYDCVYLALAMAEGATVITADKRFQNITASKPYLARHVVLLSDLDFA